MATLTKSGARKPLATGRFYPAATAWHDETKMRGYTVGIMGDDGKAYEIVLSADEMMSAISCWIQMAAREHTLMNRPKPGRQ